MIKVAITGPECSGKTTLAIALGAHFNVSWIPEFARNYLSKLERSYQQDDLDVIAQQQQNVINLMSKTSNNLMIVDTEMFVMKIWSEEKFGSVSTSINSILKEQNYDLYLLCKPDIPYEFDPLRENPEDRDRLYELYKKELEKSDLHFVEIKGFEKQRVDFAIAEIESLITK